MKHSSSSQFADDTCLLYAQNKIKSLETNSNCLWSIQVVVISLMTLAYYMHKIKSKSLETNFAEIALWSIQIAFEVVVVSADDTCLLYAQNKIKSLETNSNCLWSIQVVVSSLMTLAYYMHKIK